jgi:hypothetical protein
LPIPAVDNDWQWVFDFEYRDEEAVIPESVAQQYTRTPMAPRYRRDLDTLTDQVRLRRSKQGARHRELKGGKASIGNEERAAANGNSSRLMTPGPRFRSRRPRTAPYPSRILRGTARPP